MSIAGVFRSVVNAVTVPHDGVGDQARDILARADTNGDKVVPLDDASEGYATINGSAATLDIRRGIAFADQIGNQDGRATLREIRSALLRYDTGAPGDPESVGNHHIEGFEWAQLARDFARPALRLPSAIVQAIDGASGT